MTKVTLMGAQLKDGRLKGSPAAGAGWESCEPWSSCDTHEAGQPQDRPQLTFEGFDHLDEEVELLEDSAFYHLFPHAEVAHAGHGESPRCPPQLPDGEEQTWGAREKCAGLRHGGAPHTKPNRALGEQGAPQVFLLPVFPWI